MNGKYKTLKTITAAAIYDAAEKVSGATEKTPCFRSGFQEFLKWATQYYTNEGGQDQFYFFEYISLNAIEKQFEEHPSWRVFLIEKGFIEREQSPYKAGDRFQAWGGKIFMLSVVGTNSLQLIAEDGCSYYGSPAIPVKNIHEVTEDEFRLIAREHPERFTKIDHPKTGE